MTIICGFSSNDFPVLIGDILLTSDQLYEGIDHTPTLGPVQPDATHPFGFTISGFNQKVNILDDKCIVAWSGNWTQARAMIRDITKVLSDHGPNLDEIIKTINTVAAPDKDKLSMIMFLQENENLHYYYHSAEKVTSKFVDNAYVAGSGSIYVKKFFGQLEQMDKPPHVDAGAPHYTTALGFGLTLSSQCVGREILSAGNLIERWGGAIELGYILGGVAQKLNNIMHFHLSYEDSVDRTTKINLVPIITKTEYQGDLLVIRRVQFMPARVNKNSDSGSLVIESDKISVVPPILKHVDPSFTPDIPDLEYDVLCTWMHYNLNGVSKWSQSFVDFCHDKRRPLRIEQHGEEYSLAIEERLGDRVRQAVTEYKATLNS